MKKLFLMLALAAGPMVFAQGKAEKETLKTFVERVIPEKVRQSADKITLLVDGKEIRDPEKYDFDIYSMKEMKINIDDEAKKDSGKLNYTVSITRNKG